MAGQKNWCLHSCLCCIDLWSQMAQPRRANRAPCQYNFNSGALTSGKTRMAPKTSSNVKSTITTWSLLRTVLEPGLFCSCFDSFWLSFDSDFCLYFCWGHADLSIFHLYTSDPIATRGAACSLPSVQAWRTPMGWGGIQGIWMDVRNVSLTCSILIYRWTWVIWPDNCQQTMMYTHVVQEYVFFHESDECFAGHEFAETIIGFWMLAGGRMCIGYQELFNDCLSLAQTGDTWWHVSRWLSQSCDSYAPAFCCRNVGPNGPNNNTAWQNTCAMLQVQL